MTRGAGTAGRAVKKPSRKAVTRRARKTASKTTPSAPSIDNLQAQLNEALAREAATAEVLEVISSTSSDLQPVFDAMLEKATRICVANFGILWLRENDGYRGVATRNVPAELYEERQRDKIIYPNSVVPLARIVHSKRPEHIADIRTHPAYVNGFRPMVALAELGGARTLLVVPMLKGNEVVGAISIFRQEVRPFSDRQVELVKNFATQAVIAIENARLVNELRQRTDDLSEALEQQTATSEVLRVISSSPGELEPVFQEILENATRLCGANFGNLYRWDGEELRLIASHNTPLALVQSRNNLPFRPGPETPTGRMVATKSVTHVADLAKEPGFIERDPLFVEGVEVGGIRTLLSVPMLKENVLVGAFSIYRQEVQPFTEKQIELVKNFAAQAVIAIENTRLLNELRESLQQQTATAHVLKVISGSAFDLKRVLEALIESATQLCGATRGHILQFNGAVLALAAAHNAWPGFTEYLAAHPFRPGPGTITGRAAAELRTVHVHDVLQEPNYELSELVKQQDYRTVLGRFRWCEKVVL